MPSSYNSIMSSLGFPSSGPPQGSISPLELTPLSRGGFEAFVNSLGLDPNNLSEEVRAQLMQMYIGKAAADQEDFWNKRGAKAPHTNVGARGRG